MPLTVNSFGTMYYFKRNVRQHRGKCGSCHRTVELSDYGYHLAYPKGALSNPSLKAFRDWIVAEALG